MSSQIFVEGHSDFIFRKYVQPDAYQIQLCSGRCHMPLSTMFDIESLNYSFNIWLRSTITCTTLITRLEECSAHPLDSANFMSVFEKV
jgi:hypothetical protein